MATLKKTTIKKPLAKAQTGKTVKTKTPFQQYMKTPGAVASDTIAKRDDINVLKKAPNKPGLDAAYRKTYGDDYAGRQSDGIYTMSAKDADAQDRRMGPSRKMGGVTKKLPKAQFGRTVVKSKTTREGISDSNNNDNVKDVYNRKGDLVKTKINRTTTYNDGVKPLKSKITLKPGKPTVTKFPSLSRTMRIKSDPETGEAIKKVGGAVKSLVKAQYGAAVGPKKPVVKKTVAPSKKIIDSAIPMKGPSRPATKPMLAKKGGVVKSKKK